MSKATLIEKIDVTRDYGFDGAMAIVDHPKHGRLLIEDGYGGEGTIDGGCVRWRHGSVYKLHQDDTFGVLAELEWNEGIQGYAVVTEQLDDTRPWQNWEGDMLAKLAESLGL